MNLNDLIGTPYAQLDCYQLVRLVSAKKYGKDLPDIVDYAADPVEAISVNSAMKGWVELDKREVGCIVVLGQTPSYSKHVGIYIGNSNILHTCRKFGAIIQDDFQLLATGYVHQRYYRWVG